METPRGARDPIFIMTDCHDITFSNVTINGVRGQQPYAFSLTDCTNISFTGCTVTLLAGQSATNTMTNQQFRDLGNTIIDI
jgi:polygalacturonase